MASNTVAPVTSTISGIQSDDLTTVNQRFYDRLWRHAYFIGPERFNTWPLVKELAARAANRLEVGPGMRPRLPVAGTHFVDISEPALVALKSRGGLTQVGNIARLPYPDSTFELACALDIIEHTVDQETAFAELSRVVKPGGAVLLAVPLHPDRWTTFDTVVGHAHRYGPDELLAILARHNLSVERSAAYGMQSTSDRLCEFTALGFERVPRITIFIYNHFVMPLGLALQKPLQFQPRLLDTAKVDEVLLVCKRLGN